MDQRKVRYLIGAAIVLALAGYNFATYTSTSSLQSTFNLPSGEYFSINTPRNAGDKITGSFQENSGNPVNFYIMNSAQYSSFETGNFQGGVYSIQDSVTGTISYNFVSQDSYYLVFRHGTGLINSTQTVFFQRSYITHDTGRLTLAFVFVAIAGVDLVFAFWRRKPKPVPAVTYPTYAPNPPVTSNTQTAWRATCPNCGATQLYTGAAFCSNCGKPFQ